MKLNGKLNETIFTYLDVETTGLNPYFGDRICEIALLKCQGEKKIDCFQTLINPAYPISPGSAAINGITDAMVKDAPYFKDVIQRVLEFLNQSVIVCHNARFDLSFLGTQMSGLGLANIRNSVLDTLILARKCYRFPSNSLGNIARFIGLEVKNEHRALDDVYLTKDILDYFISDLKKNKIENLADLVNLQGEMTSFPEIKEISLPPALEEAIGSGKKLKIKYVASNGEETLRTIEPIEVNAREDYLYLRAWCDLRQEQRTFRFDRIIEMKLNDS